MHIYVMNTTKLLTTENKNICKYKHLNFVITVVTLSGYSGSVGFLFLEICMYLNFDEIRVRKLLVDHSSIALISSWTNPSRELYIGRHMHISSAYITRLL